MKVNKIRLSWIASTAILSATLFVGCGSDSVTSLSSTTSVSGQGLAKYVKDADAFLDANFDGIKNNGELSTTTNATGEYTITSSSVPTSYQVVLAGGTNSATGAAVPPTIAPKGYTIVSPLTTMVASIPEAQREDFISDMGLTEDDLNVDYNTVTVEANANIAKVVALKSVVETMIAETGSSTVTEIENIAKAVKRTVETTADLTGDSFYSTLVTNVASESGLDSTAVTALTATVNTVKVATKAAAAATTSAALTTAKADAEKLNAVSAVVSSIRKQSSLSLASNDITIGDTTVTIDDNNNFIVNHAALTETESLSDFFDVSFVVNTAFTKPIEKIATLSVKVELDGDATKYAQITIPNVTISTGAGQFDINIPSGTTISGTTANIDVAPVSAATTKALNLTTEAGVVEFSVQKLLNAFGNSTAISNYIDSFNAKARTEDNYKVTIGYKITDEKSTANSTAITNAVADVKNNTSLALDASEKSDFDSAVTTALTESTATTLTNTFADVSSQLDAGYVGFTGTVYVGSEDAYAQAVIDAQKAIDKLQLKDDTVTIGDATTTISRGVFTTVYHDKVDSNLSSLYKASFTLENLANEYHSLEDGDSKELTLGISIKNITTVDSKQRLFAVMDGVTLSREAGTSADYDGEYKVTVGANATLKGYAIKADGQPVSATITNLDTNGPVTTTDGAIVNYDLSTAIEKFKASNANFNDLEAYFNTQGKYSVRLFVTGVDGVTNTKDASNVSKDINIHPDSSDIDTAFANDTFEISGDVYVGYSATQIVTDTKAAITPTLLGLTGANDADVTLDASDDFTLPTTVTGQDGAISWASSDSAVAISGTDATITRTIADQEVTLTATVTGVYNGDTITSTKEYTITVKALTNAEVVAMAKEALTVASSVTTGTTLDTAYTNSAIGDGNLASITWTTDTNGTLDETNTTVVNSTAVAISNVTLTATITRSDASSTKDFNTTIQPTDASVLVVDTAIFNTWANDLNETSADVTLPTFTAGTTATWATTDATIMTNAGVMTKAATDKNVTLTATLERGSEPDVVLTNAITVKADADMEAVATVKDAYNTAYSAADLNTTAVAGSGYMDLSTQAAATNAGVTVTWTKSVDSGTATAVSGTDGTVTTTSAQTVDYTALFVSNDHNDTATYSYTLAADTNRAVSASDSNLTASTSDLVVSGTRVFTAVVKDGYGNTLSGETVVFTVSGGTMSTPADTNASGVTTATFTAGSTPTTGATVTAKVGTTTVGTATFDVIADPLEGLLLVTNPSTYGGLGEVQVDGNTTAVKVYVASDFVQQDDVFNLGFIHFDLNTNTFTENATSTLGTNEVKIPYSKGKNIGKKIGLEVNGESSSHTLVN